jgi:putative peptidoglycan lipid II flippase
MNNSRTNLLRASSVVALGTIVSRITGLARNLVVVAVLGSALLGDTYNVANQMPNIVYNLIIGGSLTAVFIPQIVRALSLPNGGRFISTLLVVIVGAMGLLTVICVLGAPFLVHIFAASFVGHPEYHVTLLFMQLCLPQILFLTLYALLGQIANAQGKFASMAWAPVLNNLTLILGFYLLRKPKNLTSTNISHHTIFWLGLITTLGYIVQAIIMLPVLWRSPVKLGLKIDLQDSQIFSSMKLAGWTLIYATISQISFLVVQNLATHAAVTASKNGLTTGVGITPYNNAYLIFILPQSVFVLSLTTTLLPHISKLIQQEKFSAVRRELEIVLDRATILIAPSTVFLFFFAIPISRLLFTTISISSSKFIGLTLMGFAIGLPAYSYYTLGLRTLNAFENVKLQVKGNLIMNLLGVILSFLSVLILPARIETIGLAVILSLTYYFGSFYTINQIRKFDIKLDRKKLAKFNYRAMFISFLAVLPAGSGYLLLDKFLPDSEIFRLIRLSLAGLVFGLIYLYLGSAIRLGEMAEIVKIVKSKVKARQLGN